MTQNAIVRTAGELIEALKAFAPACKVISHEPPFTGIQLVEQGNGSILIASLWNSDEGRAHRAASKPVAPDGSMDTPGVPPEA